MSDTSIISRRSLYDDKYREKSNYSSCWDRYWFRIITTLLLSIILITSTGIAYILYKQAERVRERRRIQAEFKRNHGVASKVLNMITKDGLVANWFKANKGPTFEIFKELMNDMVETPELRESKRVLVASNLADLYCELEYLQRNPEYLVKAKAMVELELEHVRARGQYLKGFRRLLLSLIEVHINAGWHEAAATLVEELLTIYGTLSDPDITDRLGHVRALIAWARISPLPEAEMRWSAALRQNAAYNPGEDDVFTCGVIHLFISYVRFLLHDVGGSWEAFCRAVAVFSRRRPQFLIPGVGTYLYESIRVGLRSVTGWELPKVVPRF